MIIQSIFQKIEPVLIRMYYRCRYPSTPNLRGDRDIEWSWIVANLPDGPGEALDLGCGTGPPGLIAARRGYKTTAIDLAPVRWFYAHPNLNFIQKDIFDLKAKPQALDLKPGRSFYGLGCFILQAKVER